MADILSQLRAAPEKVTDAKTLESWSDVAITAPGAPERETGNPFVMTREMVVSIAPKYRATVINSTSCWRP